MPISSATRPTRLVGVSNGPIRWGEAMRIRGLGPSLLSSPSWVNRAKEALDASPHPNGLVKASHFDLDINWDGLPGDTKGIYGLFRGWLAKGLKGRACSRYGGSDKPPQEPI